MTKHHRLWCGVVWCGVVWCGVVWCGVVWCGGVVWCAEGAVTRRQWPGCLPTGTGKREGCVSTCTMCASVLLYSRDQCTVALGWCCSVDACAPSPDLCLRVVLPHGEGGGWVGGSVACGWVG